MKDSKSLKDLKNINTELSTILEMFVKKLLRVILSKLNRG